MYFDEKGRNMDKATLVADIAPLLSGYSGTIKIGKSASRIVGDTAVLSYDLDETEVIFGQNLTARATTRPIPGCGATGRGRSWPRSSLPLLRRSCGGKSGSSEASRFAGAYELAPGQVRTVVSEEGKLFSERRGKREELLPETSEIFFGKARKAASYSVGTRTGKVDALIDRRNNEDVVWRKSK